MAADMTCVPTFRDVATCEHAIWHTCGAHVANIKEELILSSSLNGEILYPLKWLPYLYLLIFINLSNLRL